MNPGKIEGNQAPVFLSPADRRVIEGVYIKGVFELEKHYGFGFGVFPSAEPDENFFEQVWTRDFCQAALNGVLSVSAIQDSIRTIFKHQREDGALPYRTERRYALVQIIPWAGPRLAKPLFNLARRGKERPLYEGEDLSSAEDTVPLVIMAAGEFALTSPDGYEFARENYGKFEKAVEFFRKKVDPEDGLAVMRNKNPDWVDSIDRGGKLGGINILWARCLRIMSSISHQLGKRARAVYYHTEYTKVKKSVLERFYDREGAYFREEEGSKRLYTTACITGSLYLLDDPGECARVQETIKERAKVPSGLKNFDPPYPDNQQIRVIQIFNNGYHNRSTWPWVACQNISAKIKIAVNHPDEATRSLYKKEAVEDMVDMARLFDESGGAYEIFEPDTRKPAVKRFYKPPRNLMANLAAYQGAYQKIKNLGWM